MYFGENEYCHRRYIINHGRLTVIDHVQPANYLTDPNLEPPFIYLIASNGQSHLALIEDYQHHRILGRTLDDATGEAFDKIDYSLLDHISRKLFFS